MVVQDDHASALLQLQLILQCGTHSNKNCSAALSDFVGITTVVRRRKELQPRWLKIIFDGAAQYDCRQTAIWTAAMINNMHSLLIHMLCEVGQRHTHSVRDGEGEGTSPLIFVSVLCSTAESIRAATCVSLHPTMSKRFAGATVEPSAKQGAHKIANKV